MRPRLSYKSDFPIFSHHPDLVYLDNAATTQKPARVIRAVTDFYEKSYSNVHRGIYDLSQQATLQYENSRQKVADLIGANSHKEIIFTGNASEAINLAAIGYAKKRLKPGDIVLVSSMEHHSNFVPWLRLSQEVGVELVTIPLTPDFQLDYLKPSLVSGRIQKIKFVALSQASNVLGTINPVAKIISHFKSAGIKAKYLVDAAQSVPHIPIDVTKLDCDFLAFSSHKMLGPSGVGVLWARQQYLAEMDPVFSGSHMISRVTAKSYAWGLAPDKFEVGTGRLEAVVGLGAAVDYLQEVGLKNVLDHESQLSAYTLKAFAGLKDVKLYGSQDIFNRLGVFSFNLSGIHPHDVAEILNRSHICVRAGHHCAQPLLDTLGITSTVRASLYLYNTKSDIDQLVDGLHQVCKILKP